MGLQKGVPRRRARRVIEMEISSRFRRENSEDESSLITHRMIVIKTPLNQDAVRDLATKFSTPMIGNYMVMSDKGGYLTIEILVDNAAWSSFSRFLYEIMNHEFSSALCKR
jgi:hypothetical protein